MSSPLEDFFNLPEDEPEDEVVESAFATTTQISSSLSTAERVDSALPSVTGLEAHDSEMDDIAKKALVAYDDLLAIGSNVADAHAGKIYEVAAQMLKTALDAKNAKADKKLKMIELQLKKIKTEQNDQLLGNTPSANAGIGYDRNDIIKAISDVVANGGDK